MNHPRQHLQRIQDFADKYLDGNLDNLADFRLTQLKTDKVFGCHGRSFDPDDTEIMRCIYVALFSDLWPELTLDSLKSGEFRGDTLNTYNTLFGPPDKVSLHPGLDRYNVSSDLKAKAEEFQWRFTTIGNMTVLPNIRVGRNSINTYRGCHSEWHDFFDRFLSSLHSILVCSVSSDNGLSDLVEANNQHFSHLIGQHGFQHLIDSLLLFDYVDNDYNPLLNSQGYYYWKKGLSSVEYEKEAHRYIDFSTSVIKNRAALMISRLKEILWKSGFAVGLS